VTRRRMASGFRICSLPMLIFVFLNLTLSTVAIAEDEEFEPLELAALLLADGHTSRAERVLDKIDLKSDDVDLGQFYSLKGLAALKNKKYKLAIRHLEHSKKLVRSKVSLRSRHGRRKQLGQTLSQLSQAYYGDEKFRLCHKNLEDKVPIWPEKNSFYLLKSACLWRDGKRDTAWRLIDRREKQAAHTVDFTRQKVLYLIDQGLFQSAYEQSKSLWSKEQLKPTDFISIGAAFRSKGQLDYALAVFEAAALRFEGHLDITIELATVYLKKQYWLNSAELFEKAAHLDGRYWVETTELYKRAGQIQRALYVSQSIEDRKEKLKQRLSIYLGGQDFEKVASLERMMIREGMTSSDEMSYALAYTFFRLGRPSKVEKYLAGITEADYFEKAVALRKSLSECEGREVQCL
jgi:tetratricopeptide (TPR) repeat protein